MILLTSFTLSVQNTYINRKIQFNVTFSSNVIYNAKDETYRGDFFYFDDIQL
jgi:hypothetical protein